MSTFVLAILGFLAVSIAVGIVGAITDSFAAVYLLAVALLTGLGVIYWHQSR